MHDHEGNTKDLQEIFADIVAQLRTLRICALPWSELTDGDSECAMKHNSILFLTISYVLRSLR